jgi:hypothetical protein
MKSKVFYTSSYSLERELNTWLSDRPDTFTLLHMTQGGTDSYTVITIIYTE